MKAKITRLLIPALLLTTLSSLLCIGEVRQYRMKNKVSGVEGQVVEYKSQSFDVVRIDAREHQVKLYWKKPDGTRFGSFRNLKTWLNENDQQLVFATNAGIFSKGHRPGGLHVEQGNTLNDLNLNDGQGNFHLMPNGVFYMGSEGSGVSESKEFEEIAAEQEVETATQSGPMLVINGKLHPAFNEGSENKYIRNGVGVAKDGSIIFVISHQPVNFFDFASLFRDRLECDDALYLDGAISRMYAPSVGRKDLGGDFTGIFAVSVPKRG